MTSQHFDDGWDNWGEDWNENSGSNGNNNKPQISQPVSQTSQQFVNQQQQNSNAPIYSPFAYQQTSSQPPSSSSQLLPPAQPTFMSNNTPQQQLQQQQLPPQTYGNPVNFFNPAQYNDSSNMLNNNSIGNHNQPLQSSGSSAFSSVQSTTPPTFTSSSSHFEKVNNYQSAKISTVQFSNSNLPLPPPPASQSYSSHDQNQASSSSLPLPPPPINSAANVQSSLNQSAYSSSIQGNAVAQQQQQQPSSIQSAFDSNLNPLSSQQHQAQYQYSQWNDQRLQPPPQQQQQQSSNEMNAFSNSWQQPQTAQFNQPPVSASSSDWQNIPQQSSGANFFTDYADAPPKDDLSSQQQQHQSSSTSTAFSAPVQNQIQQQQQPPKFENNENIQTPASESIVQPPVSNFSYASAPPSVATATTTATFTNQLNDPAYPENRERLDELPPQPTAPSLDRHNYLVTGQLSQDHSPVPPFASSPQQNISQEQNESLPPPGLSRMVVGEPENNQQQIPTMNRMVTGNELTPASYLNYQRQADGEVSTSPVVAPIRSHSQQPTFNQQQVAPPPPLQQNVESDQQQNNFNISDRNLYLVAGESDVNNQRVIPGVESNSSNNAPLNLLNPLQNLHIEDDEDFVNISVTTQHRNVDGDGMDELQVQQNQRAIDAEQREEDIEGANDSNSIVIVNPPPPPQAVAPPPQSLPLPTVHENVNPPINDQESDVREDIEGANDYSDPPKQPQLPLPPQASESQEEKRKSVDSGSRKPKADVTLSSEDSELRELENSRAKTRRSKKYDDSNDSDSDRGGARRRDNKYEDRYKRSTREKMSREEYEKYRRREKERRSGGGGRSKRNDDTDGSRYGDSRRRTDDEEDENRRRHNKRSSRGRKEDDIEGEDKERKRDRNRDRKYYDDDRRERSRRERRERDRYYEDGRRSQNASDREFDRYSKRGYEDQRYYPYDYNNYNYTLYQQQQQQYLESLRFTNPQAYEWYKNYYSGMMHHTPMQPSSVLDPTESIKSGRSSSNDIDRASTSRFLPGGNVSMSALGSLNTSFVDNPNEYHSLQTSSYHAAAIGGYSNNQPYASLNLNSQNYGYNMYGGDLRAKQAEVAQSRMTPRKFQCLHGFVSLSNGVMTTVDTLNTDENYLVKIENVPIYDRTRRLFQSYPGPLVRGVSHKKTVIEFCEEKLKQNSHVESGLRASYALLWSYLILMLRQNGTYTEADISELLMKNSEDFKNSYDVSETKIASNNNNNNDDDDDEGGDDEDDENNTDVSESEENISSEKQSANTVSQSQETSSASVLTEKNVLDKFKSYLLYGNINDALDYATDNNLWGHALFLASKVDRRQHANVMLKFATKLAYNDPLQTLYQIMSGRMPACVTNLDDKFGDWRPHLAMIISNCTDKPELVKRSIMTLGDTLLARGDVYGSHFCYLLMDPQFTDYSDTAMENGKIALLGTTIQKPFKEFASNDSIIMSEVYEYARSLSSENFFITALQKYKFLLASNILDYGNQLKCLLYMEQISKCILLQPESYDAGFITKVFTLADRLKFYDPVMEKSYEDNFNNNEQTEDPKWLQDLSLVMQQTSYSQQYSSPPQASAVPTYAANDFYNPSDFQPQVQAPQTGLYDPMGSQQQTPTHAPLSNNQVYEEHDSHQYNYEQQQQQQPSSNQMPAPAYGQQDGSFYQQQDQQQQQQQQQQNYGYNGTHQAETINNQSMVQASEQQYQQQPQQNYMQPSYDQNYQQTDYSYSSTWDQAKPTITMGNTSKFDEMSSANKESAEPSVQQKEDKKSPAKKAEESKDKKQSAQDAKTSNSWFGKLFGKGKSGPTPMKLPDDKNPAIVWDEATKRWVNKDEDPAETESFKPPPKMDDIMRKNSQTMQSMPPQFAMQPNQPQMMNQPQHQQQQPQQQQQPAMMSQVPMQNVVPQQNQQFMQQSQQLQQQQPQPQQQLQQQHPVQTPNAEQAASPAPPSAPNMFKMQKGRNLKKSYVDILGNAGHTVSQPKELAPQMDMQFFNPQAQPQGMQFYNPNDFQ